MCWVTNKIMQVKKETLWILHYSYHKNLAQHLITQPISSITDAPWFATTENIQTFTRQSDEFFVNNKYFECEMPAETSIFKQAIQIPAVYDVKCIKMFNETSNNWINLTSDDTTLSFSKKQITKNINNVSIAYYQFTNTGPMVGKRFLRFFIN